MPDLSPIEFDVTSAPASFGRYRAKWKPGPALHTEAARSTAEQGIVDAYRAARMPAPERIAWCRSPIEIERSRRANWHNWTPGVGVKHRVVDQVIHAVGRDIQRALPSGLDWDVFRAISSTPHLPAAIRSVAAVVSDAVQNLRWPLRTMFAGAVRRIKRNALTPYTPFEKACWGELEFRQLLGTYDYLHDQYGARLEAEPLQGLWNIALNAGWVVPHERVCWLSERCLDLAVDPQGRLHSGAGPALRFADGWKYFAWKGNAVPIWCIDDPDSITWASIFRVHDPVLRRCMVEIMTPERYVATGAATCIATDDAGRLWQSHWGLDIWTAVEVVNGTPEPDGTRKRYYLQVPPGMRTPTEAVAWTYGMDAEQYGQLKAPRRFKWVA